VRDTAAVVSSIAPLSEHAHTTSGWEVIDTSPTPDRSVGVGSCFLVGNGYLGYRGSRPDQGADDFVGCVVSDTYDMADGVWRELCTVPNGLVVHVELDGAPLGFDVDRDARIELALETGEVTYAWFGRTESGRAALVSMRRFASLHELHAIAQQVVVIPEQACEVSITAGIDDDIWSLNGDHFESLSTSIDDDVVTSRCVTGEDQIEIAVASIVVVDGLTPAPHSVPAAGRRGITARRWSGHVDAGAAVTVSSTMTVASTNDDDVDADALAVAVDVGTRISASGYRAALAVSAATWASFWSTADVGIDGDPAAQAALRFSIYHNRIALPAHSDRLPVGARGLSCQAYQGAAFWDQEMFNLPAVLYTAPDIARRLLVYRWRTLDGARRKARRLGYAGAFYAWISGDTGDELCPDFFFVDVLTGRPIRNHFNVWQIHISPDIAHAVWTYFEATDDLDFVADHGAEIVFEVARFLRSRARWDEVGERYELIRLLGPDEWHENVDNNAYTARLSRLALRHAAAIRETLANRRPDALARLTERHGFTDDEFAAWARLEALLREPAPDAATLLIEPFDGFFDLEDCRPADLRERLLDPGEYWGWPNGVAVHTQVSKQPDVVQMFAVDPTFDLAVQRANYDYFEPRCSHGSSLSHSVHATVAARLAPFGEQYLDQAYDYFMDTAALDLGSTSHSVVGGTFIGGMHTAANAGAYQTAVFGFGGLAVVDGVVRVSPTLPRRWARLDYVVIVHGRRVDVSITPTATTVAADPTNDAPVAVSIRNGEMRLVEPGRSVTA
jgi:kojibiose phosphorylase